MTLLVLGVCGCWCIATNIPECDRRWIKCRSHLQRYFITSQKNRIKTGRTSKPQCWGLTPSQTNKSNVKTKTKGTSLLYLHCIHLDNTKHTLSPKTTYCLKRKYVKIKYSHGSGKYTMHRWELDAYGLFLLFYSHCMFIFLRLVSFIVSVW